MTNFEVANFHRAATAGRKDYNGVLWTGLPDAVDADGPRELAAKLIERTRP